MSGDKFVTSFPAVFPLHDFHFPAELVVISTILTKKWSKPSGVLSPLHHSIVFCFTALRSILFCHVLCPY